MLGFNWITFSTTDNPLQDLGVDLGVTATFTEAASRRTRLQRFVSVFRGWGAFFSLGPSFDDVDWSLSKEDVWSDLNYGRD